MAPYSDPDLQAKQKRTINPRLLNEDNISKDAIKCRKMEVTSSSLTISNPDTALSSKKKLSRTSAPQASVETVADEDDITCHKAGQPKNRNVIIESTEDEGEIYQPTKAATKNNHPAKSEPDNCDDNNPKEELDDEELGEL